MAGIRAKASILLRRTLWGTAANPNFGGVLLVGLGSRGDPDRPAEVRDMLTAWTRATRSSPSPSRTPAARAGRSKRASTGSPRCCPWSARRGARPCRPARSRSAWQSYGSDAWFGVTQTRRLGVAPDRIGRAFSATVILSETPEIYGRRAPAVSLGGGLDPGRRQAARAPGLVGGLHRPQRRGDGQQPRPRQQGRRPHHHPGEVAGRGRRQAARRWMERGRIRRADRSERGLVFMDSPLLRSLFGPRASRFRRDPDRLHHRPRLCSGCKPSPSIEFSSSNTEIYRAHGGRHRPSTVARLPPPGDASIEAKGGEILDYLLEVASGRRTKSEALGYGGAEFVPWQIGAVM